jgi:glycosyltransferase involved in cell wall biosynthesis
VGSRGLRGCRYPAASYEPAHFTPRPLVIALAPLVSILTPSLNQVRYLPDCLASVAAQTYGDVEHIVQDGGSTDGSVEILRNASGRVRWVSEPDGGQSDALNRAFAASSGKIIGWVNSDDGYADRRAIEWAVDYLAQHPETDVVYGHTLLINEENVVLQVRAAPPFSRRAMRAVHFIVQPALFFRRSALERLDTFVRRDLEFVMDRDLLFRLAVAARIGRIQRILAFDRHQRERKVLQHRFLDERAAYDAAHAPPPTGSRLVAAGVRGWIRFGGTAAAVTLPSRLAPAIELRIPPASSRLAWQTVYARRWLPFGVPSRIREQ